jgi:hypothetical protein
MMRVLSGIALMSVLACGNGQQQRPAPSSPPSSVGAGRYQTDSLAAADAGGRMVLLELRPDSTAVLQIQWAGTTTTRTGRFSATGPDVIADFPAQDSAGSLQFRWRLISTRLVPVDWDRTQYGPAGLTLHLR